MRSVHSPLILGVVLAGAVTIASLWVGVTLAQDVGTVENPAARSFYLLSFDKAPLAVAAKAVLVQSLHSEMAIDPGLRAEVTFRVSEPLSERELEDRFAKTLADQNIALVRMEGGFRLMDMTSATQARPRLDIVAEQALPLKPGVADVLKTPAPAKKSVEPDRTTLHPFVALGASLAALMFAGAVWVWRMRGGRLIRSKSVRSKRSRDQENLRDEVVDHLLSVQPVDLSILAAACERAAKTDRSIEQGLLDLGAVSDEQLAAAYAAVTGLARWNGRDGPVAHKPPLSTLEAYVRDRTLRIVQADAWSVVVATADPLDDPTFATLSRLSRRIVTFQIARWSELSSEGMATPSSDRERALVITPWAKSPRRNGAALLQRLLARRLAREPNDHIDDLRSD